MPKNNPDSFRKAEKMAAPTAKLQELLDQHRAGDEAARNALLECSLDRLTLLAQKMFRREFDLKAFDETGDVLNKALIRLHRALDTVRPETIRAYLAIAANQIRWVLQDLAREHGQRQLTYFGDAPEIPAADGEPTSLAQWAEFHERVGKLPEEEREAFDLIVYQGLEQAEAAALIGVPLRTFKRRWLRARTLIQEGQS